MAKHHDDDFDDDERFDDGEDIDQPQIAEEGRLNPKSWYCAACGQANETLIDLYSGYDQEYVEDCYVCCRPNLIRIHIDQESMVISLQNELE